MQEENPEITFPSIKFPIITDLNLNALELANRYSLPPPEGLYDVTSLILTSVIVNLFCHEKIAHKPALDRESDLDVKGACFLYIIGTAMCRVLNEQGHDIDLMEMYSRSGNAIFQELSEDRVSGVLEAGQQLGERLFEEAIAHGEIHEFVMFVMSLGLLYSIEPKSDTLDMIVTLFGQIKDY